MSCTELPAQMRKGADTYLSRERGRLQGPLTLSEDKDDCGGVSLKAEPKLSTTDNLVNVPQRDSAQCQSSSVHSTDSRSLFKQLANESPANVPRRDSTQSQTSSVHSTSARSLLKQLADQNEKRGHELADVAIEQPRSRLNAATREFFPRGSPTTSSPTKPSPVGTPTVYKGPFQRPQVNQATDSTSKHTSAAFHPTKNQSVRTVLHSSPRNRDNKPFPSSKDDQNRKRSSTQGANILHTNGHGHYFVEMPRDRSEDPNRQETQHIQDYGSFNSPGVTKLKRGSKDIGDTGLLNRGRSSLLAQNWRTGEKDNGKTRPEIGEGRATGGIPGSRSYGSLPVSGVQRGEVCNGTATGEPSVSKEYLTDQKIGQLHNTDSLRRLLADQIYPQKAKAAVTPSSGTDTYNSGLPNSVSDGALMGYGSYDQKSPPTVMVAYPQPGELVLAGGKAGDDMISIATPVNPSRELETMLDGGMPPKAVLLENLPFEEQYANAQIRFKKYGTRGCIRITNIPFHITRAEVLAMLGRSPKVLNDADEPVHIIMDPYTNKTGDAYVEFLTPDDAMNCVDRLDDSVRNGKILKLGDRAVAVHLATQAQLQKAHFQFASGIDWTFPCPTLEKNSQFGFDNFKHFFSADEMCLMAKNAEKASITAGQ
ncbi:hypothetical protein F5Y15DRAFT_423982 [Xylariaceae sp. FL0016]|nr:hypothetical protein F5Y15DRAFT_423982 [Xylariaceae sp. FL0016]